MGNHPHWVLAAAIVQLPVHGPGGNGLRARRDASSPGVGPDARSQGRTRGFVARRDEIDHGFRRPDHPVRVGVQGGEVNVGNGLGQGQVQPGGLGGIVPGLSRVRMGEADADADDAGRIPGLGMGDRDDVEGIEGVVPIELADGFDSGPGLEDGAVPARRCGGERAVGEVHQDDEEFPRAGEGGRL